MAKPKPNLIEYAKLRPLIRNGDIALSRPVASFGRAICRVTGGQYSHATLLGWSGDDPWRVLMVGETREHKDGRLIDAATEFKHWPGVYDVFRVRSRMGGRVVKYDGDRAWAFVCHAGGCQYGYRQLWRVLARRHLGLDVRPIPNSDDPQFMRDCSALAHAALRVAGCPTFEEYDCDVEPSDLCRPAYMRYLGTVV